jgi:hypothetical protein
MDLNLQSATCFSDPVIKHRETKETSRALNLRKKGSSEIWGEKIYINY